MAIVGVPGWIGSSAVNETGQRWMSAAGAAVRRPAPFYMSQLASQSKFNYRLTIGYWLSDMDGKSYGFYAGKGGAISPNTFGGTTIWQFGPGEYMHQVRIWFYDVSQQNRTIRVMIEGLGTWVGRVNTKQLIFDQYDAWRWFRDRNGQTINVLMEYA